jgi:peptidoglycan/LPS O-acetylase OafA/YrhL
MLFIPYVNPNGMVRPILDVSWALLPEVWFYLVFYVAMKLSQKYRAHIAAGFFLMIYVAGSLFAGENRIFAQYKLSMLYLPCGVVIYYLWKHFALNQKAISAKKAVKAVLVFLFWSGSIAFNYLTMANHRIIAFFVAMAVFAAFLLNEGRLDKNRGLLWVGSISYSLYLTHEFVVKGVSRLLFSMDTINVQSFIVSLGCLVLAMLCARVVNQIFERETPKHIWKLCGCNKNAV